MAGMRGFTLTDLMITLVVASLMAALTTPAYGTFAERARVSRAIGDVSSISLAIDTFERNNNGAFIGLGEDY